MSKFMMFALVFLLTTTLISAASKDRCGRHGDSCITVSDCCPVKQMACNRFAHRCQIQITEDELMAQREKILGRRGKDY
ncbi:omega-conotoxin-like protein 1 [Phymastichus coffea]|uniref:omega-conotoxin-like protein 1 n=1 Tax=Phymastichus coffea TaxID=108790 RepID=UPI00273AB0A5|nr:omega-conotoxin-like protein 1 [Phymastichus coffea]